MDIQIFSRFNRPTVSGLKCVKPSLTSQEFKDDVNINNLLKKYIAQAQVMGVPVSELLPKLGSAAYGDITNLDDFMENQNKRAQLQQMFESLPAEVRRKYGDRLEGFVLALNDSAEYEYLAEHNILNKGQVKEYFAAVEKVKNTGSVVTEPTGSVANSATEKVVENSTT